MCSVRDKRIWFLDTVWIQPLHAHAATMDYKRALMKGPPNRSAAAASPRRGTAPSAADHYKRTKKTVYRSAWLNALEDWARLKSDVGEFYVNNPDLMVCTQHEELNLKMRVPGAAYKESCSTCMTQAFEDTVVKPGITVEQAQLEWRELYDALKQATKPAPMDYINEQRAWINYQHHCWELALKVRHAHRHEQSMRDAMYAHINDSIQRHGQNKCRYYCVSHHELGDMLPTRPLNQYHEGCLMCLKNQRKATKRVAPSAPVTDFSLFGSDNQYQ